MDDSSSRQFGIVSNLVAPMTWINGFAFCRAQHFCVMTGRKELKTGELCDLERKEAQSAMTTAMARMQMKARIGVDLETLKESFVLKILLTR
jgi:hypothetical protein